MESKDPKTKPIKKKKLKLKLVEKSLKDLYNEISSDSNNSELLNAFKNDKEILEHKQWINNDNKYRYLYPHLNDPQFNIKIAEKKEFNDSKYDGKIYEINKQAEILCNAEFELSPHQQFVRNFLSFQTPYNSLLLYHGLGSGKTCSAIGVAEEMRDYINQIGNQQRIIVVASPNVQDNFRLQLFDENKLKLIDGLWTIKSCTGNKFLKEINPMNMKGLSKENVVSQIKRLINSSYLFLGYTEFANYIAKKSDIGSEIIKNRERIIKNKLKSIFNNRLIIIDEVHNIRITDDNKDKRVARELFKLVQNVDNLRLLFLSATPLYNTYKEIIWLINLMNLNDSRGTIEVKDVFDSNGNFLINDDGEEIGKELLERKATGYISFVRGDNPYTFPYRIWPKQFAPEKTINKDLYPLIQMNGKRIIQPIEHISLYISNLHEYQMKGYNYILNKLKTDELGESSQAFTNMDSLGYILLQRPIEALNIIYPNINLDNTIGTDIDLDVKEIVGKQGLNNIMTYSESITPPSRTNFEYKDSIYGNIFSPNEIGKYSSKIKEICENILHSDGVILVYSQYLDGGLVPLALALEELGITRYGSVKSLFKTPPITNLDLRTYKNEKSANSIPAKYVMITGDKMLSPKNIDDLIAVTDKKNVDGHKVKVLLISQAGSEGLDFKYIRQVHILEPYWNELRIKQAIGRAVRRGSHKDLPNDERNVEVFKYLSVLDNDLKPKYGEKLSTDEYISKIASNKQKIINELLLCMKEASVDCLLNKLEIKEDYSCLTFGKDTTGFSYLPKISKDLVYSYSPKETRIVKKDVIKAAIHNNKIYIPDQVSRKWYLVSNINKENLMDINKKIPVYINIDSGVVYDYNSAQKGKTVKIGTINDNGEYKKI